MTQHHPAQHPIVPRERLDFNLNDQDIPKYWFEGDPFKTRLFDAMSIIFPPGEKFFMVSVRDFRDRITDPKLLDEIKGFNRQEAQHSMVHEQYNQRLRQQGIDVDRLTRWLDDLLFKNYRGRFSREYTLAITCALEHFTSIGAHSLFDERDVMKHADHRLRAMYSWHAIEEVEHKGVAYDVMNDYAKVGYVKRIAAMLHTSVMFPLTIHYFCDEMLKMDGFSWWQRRKMHLKGLWWTLKPRGGLVAPMVMPYFTYYRRNFHPWQEADQPGYEQWVEAFNLHRDPIEASELMRAAMAR
ncbi:metal-dependent hydrolase [Aquabacterium sp.]|uniref:metal-dependent hydrolase n=1 Tax=Aquabacterium sp. TaxID=1872578 RepID=UPI0025BAA4D6|nr:metal-dependent hydrolase [Aquabacterium sp.]